MNYCVSMGIYCSVVKGGGREIDVVESPIFLADFVLELQKLTETVFIFLTLF